MTLGVQAGVLAAAVLVAVFGNKLALNFGALGMFVVI